MKTIRSFLCCILLLSAGFARADLSVMACEPEWAALVSELGGEKVTVTSATTAQQDPHHIEARPSLIARLRRADLLVCTGLELEVGWLPLLVSQSANSKIAPNQPGYFEAGQFVETLEKPTRLDRSEGDVHASGNPHIQLDPRTIGEVARVLSKRLEALDPPNAAYYDARYRDFSSRWRNAIVKWESRAAPLRNVAVIEHHKNMAYLARWLGMRTLATLEPKPGVDPSAAHLSKLLAQHKKEPARFILRAAYEDKRASAWFSERAEIPVVVLPFTVGGSERAKDLFSLFDDTIDRLLEPLK